MSTYRFEAGMYQRLGVMPLSFLVKKEEAAQVSDPLSGAGQADTLLRYHGNGTVN